MSVASFIAEDLFVFRTIKSLETNPDNRWANTYEVLSIIGGDTGDLLALGMKIVEFERSLHYPAVKFIGLTISTWDEDSVPYNPMAFVSSALTLNGARSPSTSGLGLSSCFSVARVPLYGRLGHLFYRGVLQESDVEAPAGKQVFTNPPAMATLVETAVTGSGLDDYFGATATTLQFVMVNKSGSQIRPLVGFVPVGVSQVPNDHAWYNRAIPSP